MNQYATVAQFRALVSPLDSSLDALSDPTIQLYLDCAALMISLEVWGDKAQCGHIYLTAHLLKVAKGLEAGPLTQKKIGDIQATYANAVSPSSSELGSTTWGRLYTVMYDTVFSGGTTGGTLCIGVTG